LDATDNATDLEVLWQRFPGRLVGITTGARCGIDVLDLDAKHEAAQTWWRLNRQKLPPTKVVRTRSGGLHIYFAHAFGLRCSVAKIALGIDVRAEGGYVIHWPSAGLPVLCDTSMAQWPDWLLGQLISPPASASGNVSGAAAGLDVQRLAGLVRVVAKAPEGQRNDTLFWAACRVGEGVRNGDLAEDFGAAVLERAAARCGLHPFEARRTIANGMKRAVP
jgi:hypothetical protein